MKAEVELKFQVTDFDAIRKILKDSGAVRTVMENHERNTVFDRPDSSLKRSGVLLRLRKFCNEVILTVKEPGLPGPMKNRKEHETKLSVSFNDAQNLLKVLGYNAVYRYEKTREVWSTTSASVCLDKLHFGSFVEIEANSTEGVKAAAELLGFDLSTGLRESYRNLESKFGKTQ